MNRQIVLKSLPKGMVSEDNFELQEYALPAELKDGEVLLKSLYISVDPYMRGRMSTSKSYIAAYEPGKPIDGGVIAQVLESKCSKLQKGDVVLGILPWREQQVVAGESLTKLQEGIAPLSYYLGILGMPGLTAYLGLMRIGEPKKGETVVVSGAAGAVGSVVGQIAKIKGCRVVGIAGTKDKIDYLKNELGFDEVINYKETKNMEESISKYCPQGVDVYFDNVGGEISDAVMLHLNRFARIILCGQISMYNDTTIPIGPRPQGIMVKNSVLMKGFIVRDYAEYFPEAIAQMSEWIKQGKLTYRETIMEGFEKLPEAFLGLFSGKNTGKLLVKIV